MNNYPILNKLEDIFKKLSIGNSISFRDIVNKFESDKGIIIEVILCELVEKNFLNIDTSQADENIHDAQIIKLKPLSEFFRTKKQEVERNYQIVLTTPEIIRNHFLDYIHTKKCFKLLIVNSEKELYIIEPFIESYIIDLLEDEFREIARRRVKIKIITRDILKNINIKKAILRLYEIFKFNSQEKDLIELYEYWFPLKVNKNHFRHFIGLHTKTIIQDTQQAYIGSANWTQESLSRNFELGLLTNDLPMIKSLKNIFVTLMLNSKKIDLIGLYEKSIN